MRGGIDHAHGRFALLFFERVRREARQPRDDDQRVGDFGSQPDVAADRGHRAVDVDGQRPRGKGRMARERLLDRSQELCVVVADIEDA